MTTRKGIRPEQYAGPFQSYSEIPARYRLETYTADYAGEDTWQEYVENVLYEEHGEDSLQIQRTLRRGGKSWLEHMAARDRHHALARPEDVAAWCRDLQDSDRARRTTYECYFVRVYEFYDYLKRSYRHPHVYNPVLLAAIDDEATRDLWAYRVDSRPEVVDRE